MNKKQKKICFLLAATTFLSACSPINSLEPFNDKQAARLIQENNTALPARQMISIKLPHEQKWRKVIIPQVVGNVAMMFRAGENSEHWRENIKTMMVSQRKEPTITAEKLVRMEFANAAQNCQQTRPEIISQTSEDVVFQLEMDACRDQPDMKEFGKVFNGIDGVYVVWYSAVTAHVSQAQFSRMSQIIAAAQLLKDPRE